MEQSTLVHDERGVSTVEYVIILTLVAVMGITAWEHFGMELQLKVLSLADIIRNLGIS